MRGKAIIVCGVLLGVVGCGSSSGGGTVALPTETFAASTPPADPLPDVTEDPAPAPDPVTTPAAKVPAPATCAPPSGDLLVRNITPDLPPTTERLGLYPANCPAPGQPDTVSLILNTSPTGDGYCTQLALGTDNPGYDDQAEPSAPLRQVFRAVGPAC